MTPPSDDVRIALLEDAVGRLTRTQEMTGESLRKLVELEVRHVETRDALSRAFKKLQEHDDEIEAIKVKLPQLMETRGWVITGVLGVLALVGLMAFKTIFSGASVTATQAVSAAGNATQIRRQ